MFELVRAKVHCSVASRFSIGKYADCFSRGLIRPGSKCTFFDSRISAPRVRVPRIYVHTGYHLRTFADMTLSRLEHGRENATEIPNLTSRLAESVCIAMGSNLGDRVGNIESACKRMTEHGIIVTETSALYETLPMYYQDQSSFLNCVCKVNTGLAQCDAI